MQYIKYDQNILFLKKEIAPVKHECYSLINDIILIFLKFNKTI